jgi:hypothetical protein
MVAVPTGWPVGVGARVSDVAVAEEVCDVVTGGVSELVAVAWERLATDSAGVGLPSVVEHPVAPTVTTATPSTKPTAELFAICGA